MNKGKGKVLDMLGPYKLIVFKTVIEDQSKIIIVGFIFVFWANSIT